MCLAYVAVACRMLQVCRVSRACMHVLLAFLSLLSRSVRLLSSFVSLAACLALLASSSPSSSFLFFGFFFAPLLLSNTLVMITLSYASLVLALLNLFSDFMLARSWSLFASPFLRGRPFPFSLFFLFSFFPSLFLSCFLLASAVLKPVTENIHGISRDSVGC